MKKFFLIFMLLFTFFYASNSFGAGKTAISLINDQTVQSDITEKEINYPVEIIPSLLSEDETDPIINIVANAINSAPDNAEMKASILEAEALYRRAVLAFKDGKMEDSKRFFRLFIQRFDKAEIDPGLYFFLFDDFDNIIDKLKRTCSLTTPAPLVEPENFSMPMEFENNEIINKYIDIYSSGKSKARVKEAIERSGLYREIILKNLQEFGLPQELQYLPIVESLYNNKVVSKAGAVGIWQIMSHRGRALGLKINYWIDERRDPEKATKAACLYLKQLYLMFNNWHLALAAYNRGEYGLIRDMRFSNASSISEMSDRNAIPKETQKYVPQFIAAVKIATDPDKYGFGNLNIQESLKYDTIKTDKIIDLKIAAKCAQTTLEEIKRLNPALNAWCTPQGYPSFELKIPYGTKTKFLENIAMEKDLNPSPGFIKYKAVKGDYIEKIAKKYKTSPNEIYKDNPQLSKNKYLQIGQVLVVRPGRKYFQ
jgi:membrane-bound lytic murein transglycosylase D